MTLLFCDSFDHYTTAAQVTLKWTGISAANQFSPVAGVGRNSTAGLRGIAGDGNLRSVYKVIGSKSTIITGGAVYSTALGINSVAIEYLDGATTHIGVYLNGNGTFGIRRGGSGGTTLQTTSNAISPNTWAYIEFKATIHDTTGSYDFRVNGVSWASATGVDTRNGGNSTADTVRIYLTGDVFTTWDDVYICDSLGTANNDFLGDIRVAAVFPDGAGTYTEWTPSTGSNYTCVDETTPNDDTDYVATSGTGNRDTYNFGVLPAASGTVLGLQTVMYTRKDDAGSRFITSLVYYNSTLYSGSAQSSVSDTYSYKMNIFETNPNTAARWTIPEINATEFGIRLEG